MGYTGLLFWVTMRQSRELWRRIDYWFTMVGLLVVHSLAFTAVLRAYPEWRMIWFMPVVIVEAGLFGAITYEPLGYVRLTPRTPACRSQRASPGVAAGKLANRARSSRP